MIKIKAFLIASVLFVFTVVGIHIYASSNLPHGDKTVGLWISNEKNASYDMVAENISGDTMLYLGSSEFDHGTENPAHPSNLFNREDMDVMCIGGAYNQCLTHAIAVGALGPELESKKVVLLVSPTWFLAGRDSAKRYGMRFIKNYYTPMMNNPLLSDDTKKELGGLTRLTGNRSSIKRKLDGEKYLVRSGLAWGCDGRAVAESLRGEVSTGEPDFAALRRQTEKSSKKELRKKYNMRKDARPMKRGVLKRAKNKHAGKKMTGSKEYDYLQLFIDVCREQNIELMLVLQPVNGKWYDYTGLERSERQQCYRKIGQIAEANNVRFYDLSGEEYTEGFFLDAVHPSEKGWLMINEEVYKFYKRQK